MATFPKAIFAMSSVLLYIAVVMLLLIRPHVQVTHTSSEEDGLPPSESALTIDADVEPLGVENALDVAGNLSPGPGKGKGSVRSLSARNSPLVVGRTPSLSPYRERGAERLNSPSVVGEDLSDVDENELNGTGAGVGRSRSTIRRGRRSRSRRESEDLGLYGREGEDAETVADRRRSSMIRLSMSEEMQAGV